MKDVELLYDEFNHGHYHPVALVITVHTQDGGHDVQIAVQEESYYNPPYNRLQPSLILPNSLSSHQSTLSLSHSL